ncbi:uncharacterized protein An07g01860 [Aspergillus niger]|uniref:Contig An07c0030, genomic contig n=2 Tax=Aspergillus niger TaxID=5061 RepID=A2QMF0_ASPNC|nr:uncharacterized protein An07g01860 [Aspergillus niger]CAK48088.1 unnamed protein product [Aspergillus niger]
MTIIAGHALLYGKENCFLICMWRLDRLLGSEGSAVLHGAGSLDADHLPLVKVYVDGEVRRGNYILKALCLGAKAVLVGVLQAELEMAMRLVGITDPSQTNRAFVNTQDLGHLVMQDVGTTDSLEVVKGPYQINFYDNYTMKWHRPSEPIQTTKLTDT